MMEAIYQEALQYRTARKVLRIFVSSPWISKELSAQLARTYHMTDEILCIEDRLAVVQCKDGEHIQASTILLPIVGM